MISGRGSFRGVVIGFPFGKRCDTTSVFRTAAKSRTGIPLEHCDCSRSDTDCGPRQLRNTGLHLFRGNCPSETLLVRERGAVSPFAKHPKPCNVFVWQWFSDLGGTTGPAAANGCRGGSDPPEIGPRMHSGAFRRGRSRDFSLQEGGSARRVTEASTSGIPTVVHRFVVECAEHRRFKTTSKCVVRGFERRFTVDSLTTCGVGPPVGSTHRGPRWLITRSAEDLFSENSPCGELRIVGC